MLKSKGLRPGLRQRRHRPQVQLRLRQLRLRQQLPRQLLLRRQQDQLLSQEVLQARGRVRVRCPGRSLVAAPTEGSSTRSQNACGFVAASAYFRTGPASLSEADSAFTFVFKVTRCLPAVSCGKK